MVILTKTFLKILRKIHEHGFENTKFHKQSNVSLTTDRKTLTNFIPPYLLITEQLTIR